MSDALTVVTGEILSLERDFNAVSVDPGINFLREAGFACQILEANSYLLDIARGNRASVVAAVTNIAAIGISLNPALKHAYLVPRDKKVILDISYRGMLHLAIASGSLLWGQAEVVYEADQFIVGNYSEPPVHNRQPFTQDRGEIVGVYCVVKTADGDYLTTTMTIAEVYGIRDRSESWKAHVAKKSKTPWQSDPVEMIKKTVIKRAYKMWPMSDRVQKAGHVLDTDGGEGFGTTEAADSAPTEILGPARAAAAGGRAEFARYWREDAADPVTREMLRPHVSELQEIVQKAERDARAAAEGAAS